MAKSENETTAAVFTKEQILKSETYCNNRDMLDSVLEDGKTYTKEQIKKAIEKFYKR